MENPVLDVSSRGLVGSFFKLSAMKVILAVAYVTSGLLALAASDGLSEYGSPEFGRIFRPSDLKMVETRPTKLKSGSQQLAVRKQRPTPQVVYGKPEGQQVRLAPPRASHKKFKPSPQDPFFPSESLIYAPSHKYLQKYASQLYSAQKNSGHLSEYQKYILGQDPAVKKFVFSRTPKKLTVVETSTAAAIITTTGRPSTTSKPKKEEVPDSAAQSSGYKFVFKPEYIPVPVYTTQDKDTFSGYDASSFTASQQIAPAYSLGDQFNYKLPATYGHNVKSEEDQHEYPTKEPKYEFQYEVKDHEKNSNFGHAEARQGKTTYGKYFVQLSDGRLETVKYWADKTGYHAEVDFKGHAKHPQTKPKEHDFAAGDLKLFAQEGVTPQFYSVSENSPIEYH